MSSPPKPPQAPFSPPPKIKVCGITNKADALLSVQAGADALGFIFAPHSKRYVLPEQARAISLAVGPCVARVGVFVARAAEQILAIAEASRMSALQLHGEMPPETLEQLREHYPLILVLSPQQLGEKRALYAGAPTLHSQAANPEACLDRSFDDWCRQHSITLMLDAPQAGSGQPLDWAALVGVFPLGGWLAGGLGPHNVQEAITLLRPAGVDAVSHLEASAGRKDGAAVRLFVAKAKALD